MDNRIAYNEQKISVISCVNDERMYEEACLYLDQLNVPAGMEVELIAVREAESMTEGYQAAMLSSDAKYKIYMHQDVFLINKDIFIKLVEIFRADALVGMIGLIGAEKLAPGNPCWWIGTKECGAIVAKKAPEKNIWAVRAIAEGPYMDVEAIDGAFMATQYDLPWRTDLFKGWHFYDTSQTFEYSKAGYRTVIPRQTEPWFIHFNGRKFPGKDYEKAMEIFAKHYKW